MVTIDYNINEKTMSCSFPTRLDTNASLIIDGEINKKMDSIPELNGPADRITAKIVFDMKETSFISSSFIRICVATAKKVPSGHFSIRNCDPFIKKTFKISGLDTILNVT